MPPRGRRDSLRAVIGADPAQAIAPLADLLGIPEAFRPDARRAQAMAPLRLAGSMSLGARTPTSADLVLDGEAQRRWRQAQRPASMAAPSGWRTGPADRHGPGRGRGCRRDRRLAGAGQIARAAAAVRARDGCWSRPAACPAQGLASLASADAGGLALGFRGQLVARRAATRLPASWTSGPRTARASPRSPAWRRPLRLDGLPIAGTLKLAADSSTLAIDRLALNVGGSEVQGTDSRSRRPATGAASRHASTSTSFPSPSCSSALLDQRLAVAATAETAISGRQSLWSGRAFRCRRSRRLRGQHPPQQQAPDGRRRHRPRARPASTSRPKAARSSVKRIEGAGLGGRCSAQRCASTRRRPAWR